jgi:uncharacterized membrane protein YhaH (DUF805 family)
MTTSAAGVPLSQPLYGASFGQAFSRFFKKYATFSGRASRSEYWWSVLAIGIIQVVLSSLIGVFGALGGGEDSSGAMQFDGGAIVFIILLALFGLVVLIPGIAVIVRRLHDVNYTGWLYLITFTGIGSVVLLVFMFLAPNPAGARYDK